MKRKAANLGDKVKDSITGYTGIVVSITAYLNGCDRICVQSKFKKDGSELDAFHFDEPQVSIIKRKAFKVEPDIIRKQTGGPAHAYSPKKTPEGR